MQISCENCGTMYDLDDSVLPAQGAPVQCTTCNHVFFARPGWAERTMMGNTGQMAVPAAAPEAPPPPEAPVLVDAPLEEEPPAGATMMMRAPAFKQPAAPAAGAPVKVDAPLEEEPPAGATMMMRAPVIKPAAPPPPSGAPVKVDAPLEQEPPAGATMMMRAPIARPAAPAPAAVPEVPAVEEPLGEHDTLPGLSRSELAAAVAPPMADAPAGSTVVYRVPARPASEPEPAPPPPPPPAAKRKPAPRPAPEPEPEEEEAPAPPPKRSRPAPSSKRSAPPQRRPAHHAPAPAARSNTGLIVTLVLLVLISALGATGFLLRDKLLPVLGLGKHVPKPAAAAKAQAAFEALLKDDGPNLERAAQTYAEAIAADAKFTDAKGDRALALIMQAEELRAEAAYYQRKAQQKEAQLNNAQTAPKNPNQKTIIEDEIRGLKAKAQPLASKAQILISDAFETARKSAGNPPTELAPLRALAYYYAVEGDSARAGKFAAQVAHEQPDDALTLYVAAVAQAAGDRDVAITLLGQALQKEPRLLRANFELARLKRDRGTLQVVRNANSFHMRSQWLLEEWAGK